MWPFLIFFGYGLDDNRYPMDMHSCRALFPVSISIKALMCLCVCVFAVHNNACWIIRVGK